MQKTRGVEAGLDRRSFLIQQVSPHQSGGRWCAPEAQPHLSRVGPRADTKGRVGERTPDRYTAQPQDFFFPAPCAKVQSLGTAVQENRLFCGSSRKKTGVGKTEAHNERECWGRKKKKRKNHTTPMEDRRFSKCQVSRSNAARESKREVISSGR